MAADLIIKANNLLPAVVMIARDAVGPVDLTGVTAQFRLVNVLTGAVQVNDAPANVAAPVAFTASGATMNATGHPFNDGESVTLTTTGALPGNLTGQREYFIVNATANTLQLALIPGGTPITTTNAGSGTHSFLSGRVTYQWQAGDTLKPATYFGEIRATQAGQPISYPNTRQLVVEILSDLTDLSDRTVAIKAVMDRVQPDAAPQLSQGEIELEVDRAQLASVWQADTAYSIGQIIVPPTRNGHSYTVTQPGTSGSVALTYSQWLTRAESSFPEGASNPRLTWEEIGDDIFNPSIFGAERNVYDINRAARECWKLKARKASQFVDDGDTSFEQMYKHCVEQAQMFIPFMRDYAFSRG